MDFFTYHSFNTGTFIFVRRESLFLSLSLIIRHILLLENLGLLMDSGIQVVGKIFLVSNVLGLESNN